MIISKCYDVEILPNFFSISIIDVTSYLKEFKDAVNNKGKPIPLVQKYTVKEIKEKLANVKKESYYITDTDDSMLFPMLKALNDMRSFINEKGDNVKTHMFGYNSNNYDKLMIAAFLMLATNTNTTKELITKLYEVSKKIIETQNDKERFKTDTYLKTIKYYKLPYYDIDLMKIFALNKVGKGVDANGNTIFFAKSLKQTSINLQWYELLEYELPEICDKDANLYLKQAKYKNFTIERLNKYVDKWDRYMIDEYIKPTLYYNDNDTFICCEIIRLNIDEIRARYNVSKAFNSNVLNSSRSNIGDIIFEKFYSEFSGLRPFQWKGKKTERTKMAFKRILLPFISFKTKILQDLLKEMETIVVTSIGKKAFVREIELGNLIYTIATGGIHTQDIPRELKSKLQYRDVPSTGELTKANIKNTEDAIWDDITDDSYIYVHFDITSFYPSLIINFNICPKHLDTGVFVKLIKWIRDTRVEAKHSKEEYIDGIPKDVLALVLKIVINAIYGKLGYEYGDLYDRLCVLNVTINGQLLIMMLCEELELNGIEVMSANTDGIVVKLHKKNKDLFDKICEDWKSKTGFDGDSELYNKYVNLNINNYFVQELNGKMTYKGILNPFMYLVDLQKGYDMPIVAKAVVDFFIEDKPIMETLYEATNIMDFCKTQNVGRQYKVTYRDPNNKYEEVEIQRNVRYYVSLNGGVLTKVHLHNNSTNRLAAGEKVTVHNSHDDKDIIFRNINYNYYYRECIKIIDPIKLQISNNQKSDKIKGTASGKNIIKKYSGMYKTLFDDE